MIKVYLDTNLPTEPVVYENGEEYSFDENRNWMGIFDSSKRLIATIAAIHIVRVESGFLDEKRCSQQ